MTLKDALGKCGIQVYSATERFEDTSLDRAMESIASTFAQLDNETRAERCKGGMVEGVRECRWMWNAPIGYANGRWADCRSAFSEMWNAPIGYANGRDITGKRNIVLDDREDFVNILRSSWHLIVSGSNETEASKIVKYAVEDSGL